MEQRGFELRKGFDEVVTTFVGTSEWDQGSSRGRDLLEETEDRQEEERGRTGNETGNAGRGRRTRSIRIGG